MWGATPRSITAAFYPSLVEHDGCPGLEQLAQIPSLVLTGTDDTTIPSRHSEHIAAVLGARARMIRVPDAGHMVNMTHPDVVTAHLRELIEEGPST